MDFRIYISYQTDSQSMKHPNVSRFRVFVGYLNYGSLIGTQLARGGRRKAKNRQLRASNQGCLTIAALTTEP